MGGPGSADAWLPEWDGALYAANTSHHRIHDDWFLSRLPLRPTDRVLDLGCGAGDFTATLAGLVPEGEVVGVEPQASLLEEARTRARSNQSFVEGPAQALAELLPEDASFDVVLSRAVLHWVPFADHAGVLADAFRLLRPGGWLRIEMGGVGNIGRTVAVLDRLSSARGGRSSPWTFPDAGTELELVEAAGFEVPADGVRTVAQRRPFDLPGLLGWLRSQIVQAYEHDLPEDGRAAFRAEVEASVDELRRHDGTFDQTYVRLDLLARKPE